jgi:hypothetical protein
MILYKLKFLGNAYKTKTSFLIVNCFFKNVSSLIRTVISGIFFRKQPKLILFDINVLLFGKSITIFLNVVIAPSSIKAQFKLLYVTTFVEILLTEKIISPEQIFEF